MRILLTATTLFVCLVLHGGTAAADPPLLVQVSPKIASQSIPFTVTVRVGSDTEPVTNLLGVGFQLRYDAAALSVMAVRSGLFLENGSTVQFEHVEDTAGFAAFSIARTAAPGATGSGVVAIFDFVVDPTAKDDRTYSILIEDIEAIDSSGAALALLPVSGSIYVERPVPTIASSWSRIKQLLQ